MALLSSGANESLGGTFVSVASVDRTLDADSGKGVTDVWGEEFEHLCAELEPPGKGNHTLNA